MVFSVFFFYRIDSGLSQKPEENKRERKAVRGLPEELDSKAEMGEKMPVLYRKENSLVIEVAGELDHHRAAYIREKSDYFLIEGGIRNLVFDFTGTDFMDSSGIGLIMGRYKKVVFTGGKAAVCGVGEPLFRVFELSGILRIIEQYETVEDAVEAFSNIK